MINNKSLAITNPEITPPEVSMWVEKASKQALDKLRNPKKISSSLTEAIVNKAPVPLILTFCPAIENLVEKSKLGQTRKLVPLTKDNLRLRSVIKELAGLQLDLKTSLGINASIFLVFADSLERDAEKMFVNVENFKQVVTESVGEIQNAFLDFDSEFPGWLQKKGIRIPKVRKQSELFLPGKAVGTRAELISAFEKRILDPSDTMFELWLKHIKLTRKDESFVATGWQSIKGSETLWNRVRFLLAEFAADGVLLPKFFNHFNKKDFSEITPQPIFFASSTRLAGIEMEADGFSVQNPTGLMPIFHNIGRWTEKPRRSPWIETLLADIMKSNGQN